MRFSSVISRWSLTFAIAFVTCGLLVASASAATQIGGDINGQAAGDAAGFSVALSGDASVVAVGSVFNTTGGANAGSVRVYFWNGVSWSIRGSALNGSSGDYSGYSVALSNDGNVLAIGSIGCNASGVSSGCVRIYTWNGVSWTIRGAAIPGGDAGGNAGYSVALSSDGTLVAFGAPNDGAGAGRVRVFAWNGSSWNQRGSNINGEAAGDNSGGAISLSSSGDVLAIGARLNDGNGTNAGQVRVYGWNGTTWAQRGTDFDGDNGDDEFGTSVAVSGDGRVLAAGALGNDAAGSDAGRVRTYVWGGSSWSQRGAPIDGQAAFDYAGSSVSLSSDGSTIAVGAPQNAKARVYGWSGSSWAKRGDDLSGLLGSQLGNAVSLSSDASTLAVGARYSDGNGSASGKVRIFSVTSVPATPNGVTALAGNSSALVSWVEPTTDGGGAITRYTVTASPGGAQCAWSSGPLQCSVSGLSNGTVYTFTVTATNSAGTGAASTTSNSVTPAAPTSNTSEPARSEGSRGTSTASTEKAVTPTQPKQVDWSQPAKGKPLEASFKAESGTNYSIRATLKKKSVSGTCSVTQGTATCSIKLKSPGTWLVAITPSKGGVKGKPASKTIRV